jgi:hypothetical protein
MAGAVPARAAAKARVVVGFVGSPPPGFQNVLLNVQAVRLNSKNNPSPTGGGWQRIPTPPGIGGQGQNAELQIDLNATQNIPQLFNTVGVKPNTYRTAELLLDPNNPGVLIPNCPQSGRLEGCINYPIALNGGNLISVNDSSSTGLVAAGKGQLGVLMLKLQVMVNQAPTTPGGAFLVTITLNTIPPTSVQGNVTGMVNVTHGTGSTTGKIRTLGVTAEAIGTNTAIASSPVKTGKGCPPAPGGCFTLALPAAGGINTSTTNGFGTLYDLAVAGGGDTYAAQRLPPLYPGQTLNADFTGTTNSLTGNQTLGNITGQVFDGCTTGGKTPVVGATLELLIPPINSTANCMTDPEQCVTVATANTSNTGGFPLPGTLLVPAEFDNVPALAKNNSYVMKITAPGYDDLLVMTKPSGQNKNNGGTCSTDSGATFGKCNLMLNRGTITGTIPITPPLPGQTTLVQVFAEDTTTNNVKSALPMPVSIKGSNPGTVNFTLNVPTATLPMLPSRTFDLFATTIDLYQGFTDPYQGHTVAVLSGVQIPSSAGGVEISCATATATFPPDQIIDCIGHGSITGQVQNANLGTSVVLSKQNVQLNSSIVENQSPLPNPSNNYSFCIPADTYDVQRFQLPEPSPNMTPLAMPTASAVPGDFVTVTIPPAPLAGGASPTPTPAIKCPTSCSNPDGSCPGICNNTIAPML